VEEENDLMHVFLNTQNQQSIAALHIPFEATKLTQTVHFYWKKQNRHQEKWSENDFRNWVESLSKKGFISSQEEYVGGSIPEQLILQFFPFKQGMLYIGNSEPLTTENEELCQTLAGNFSVAYDRYEDFTKLEIAKKNVEIALKDLRTTQDQLVQQEKLASLGQLTAGIAHEIKNPLNFVNNFSDLSIEMVTEVLEEVSEAKVYSSSPQLKERFEEMTDLLHTIEINLKKIHEHGTRANDIVTSMLQHSRGGSGETKEVDLNELLAEFSNLAYHGMRAGKDPINLDLNLDLAPNLPMVSLIKEDFSRVIINLCTNAFDALRVKTRKEISDYKPSLTIRTRSEDKAVYLEIEDNGPGIPEEILDKILQPFFTTKKGTEGTGLGLSISHDIIKAHRGQLDIETLEGKGTKFIISLPINLSANQLHMT
jgi:signal transduction histidine kinase